MLRTETEGGGPKSRTFYVRDSTIESRQILRLPLASLGVAQDVGISPVKTLSCRDQLSRNVVRKKNPEKLLRVTNNIADFGRRVKDRHRNTLATDIA